ncbi:MocR-like pyridoxine biosynthesis transcription factor PdxR [Flindersiella endophytica]
MARASESAEHRASELLLELELKRGRLRRSLRETLRSAIQDGRLVAGTRLPSSRALAGDLGVSRGVVSDAYDQLVAEGYLEVRPRSAPVVAAVAGPPPPSAEAVTPGWRYDFTATTPDTGLFPRREWVRAVERALRNAPDSALDYGDHRGRIELRTALAGYLGRVRGVRADPGRIVVAQGFTQVLDLLCRTLARRGAQAIAVESPSLPDVWSTIAESGLAMTGVPVDAAGLVVDRLGTEPAVVVTPAHQFPTGAVMSRERRLALLEWAAGTRGLIVEDDYDAEFRYDRTPVGAVQGLDPARVVHVGTAAKTLAPGLRLAWASLPAELVEEVRERKAYADSGSPAIDQLALAELIGSGAYERHVARARQAYRRRRDRLIEGLAGRLPRGFELRGAAAGLHVLLTLPPGADDVALARAAAAAGIGVRPLSPMALREPAPGLLLGYGRLGEARIGPAVAALAGVLAS